MTGDLRMIERQVWALCDGTLSEPDAASMVRLLREDAGARACYLRCMDLHAAMHWRSSTPAILKPVGETARPLWLRRATVFLAAASIVLTFIVGISYLIQRPARSWGSSRVPVAVIADATGAAWGECDVPTAIGSPIPGGWLRLKSGTVRIDFYSGATVTLHGPAEFGLNSPMRGLLRSGKLTAYCPPPAHGFTIGGPGIAVVDLGTRFTMSVDRLGRTDVSVGEGKVRLESDTGEKQELPAGRTARMARDEPIVLLPPEPITLDLADIVGGGNGLGTGHDQGIDPATGKVALTHSPVKRPSDRAYHPTSIPGIDGVFIPAPGRQQITSTGLSLTLPTNLGTSWDGLWNGANIGVSNIADGVDYGQPPHTILGLHSNKGITFDLRALGAAHPGYRVQRFAATAVNTNQAGDFWVLVDGRVVFHQTLSRGQADPIRFDLHEQDRFLTVMTVGGGWLFLADAKLTLTPTVSNDSSAK